MYVGRYNYEELRNAAVKNPNEETLSDLGKWFQNYGWEYWNGACFDADGYSLYPVYIYDEKSDTHILISWELR